MVNRIFEIDPLAAIQYGLYNALKKGEGSFEDFLLHYDSHSVNEGDNSWFTKLVTEDISASLGSSEVINAMSLLAIESFDVFAKANFFDTQVASYKLQVLQEMAKRGEKYSGTLSQFYQKFDTMI